MIIGLDGNEANVKNRVGSGVYAYELLKQFAQDRSHNFIVFLKNEPLPDLPKENTNYKYQIFGPRRLWTQFALPLKLSFNRKIDIFFTLGHYGPRFSKIPYIITIHDLSYLHYPKLFTKNDLYQLTNWTKYSVNKSAHIIAVSQTTKKDIINNYKVDSDKISVIYEGYDKKRFKPQSMQSIDKVKKKYKISKNYIIFIGTLQPRKNLEKLLEAFNQLSHQPSLINQHFQLVIVGKKGWLYNSIFEKVKELKLENKVIFTGYISDINLPALISGAQVYILPSLWEGFGIPVIEAQACGVPVVVSNISSLPEVIGDSGILIDPKNVNSITDGLKRLLIDHNLRQKLINKGYQNIKRFSWEQCSKQTIDVIEKVYLHEK